MFSWSYNAHFIVYLQLVNCMQLLSPIMTNMLASLCKFVMYSRNSIRSMMLQTIAPKYQNRINKKRFTKTLIFQNTFYKKKTYIARASIFTQLYNQVGI